MAGVKNPLDFSRIGGEALGTWIGQAEQVATNRALSLRSYRLRQEGRLCALQPV
jgi:hypothetical protein